MKPEHQIKNQLDWLRATASAHSQVMFDIAVGDAKSRPDGYFRRAGFEHLTAEQVLEKMPEWRWANTRGVNGKAERPLNIYFRVALDCQNWLVLDDLTADQCRQLAKNRTYMMIRTSPDCHHLWLATTRLITCVEREHCQKVLVAHYKCGDARSTSGEHLARLAGFKNAKRNYWVELVATVITDKKSDVDVLLQYPAPAPEPDAPALAPAALDSSCSCVLSQPQATASRPSSSSTRPQTESSGRNESDAEFGWAAGWLSKGLSKEEGIKRLAERATARQKPNAESYAKRTFAAAERRAEK